MPMELTIMERHDAIKMEPARAYVKQYQIKMAHAHKSATMDTAYIDTWRKVNLNNQIHLSKTHLLKLIHVN